MMIMMTRTIIMITIMIIIIIMADNLSKKCIVCTAPV